MPLIALGIIALTTLIIKHETETAAEKSSFDKGKEQGKKEVIKLLKEQKDLENKLYTLNQKIKTVFYD